MIILEDLKKMSVKELREELDISKKNLFRIRLDIVSSQEKKNNLVKDNKKYIAQINTIITDKLYKIAYEEASK